MKNKKFLALLLAGTMFLSVVGCGNQTESAGESVNGESQTVASQSGASTETEEEKGIVFPLEKEVTFDVMIPVGETEVDFVENCKFWQDLYEATNVKINLVEVIRADALSNLNSLFVAGKEPDAIFSAFIGDTDMSVMAANDLLLPLDEYFTDDIMPNFTSRVLAEKPDVMGAMAMSDGQVYTMPFCNALKGAYMECPFWINKVWVEKAGWKVEDIKTIDDLETVLTYFRDNDMNGNGDLTDEIPYIVKPSSSDNHLEAFLGLYGIATKDSTYENYVTVKDGKVIFAPMTAAWKDAIKKLADWFDKGLLWEETFTHTKETYQAARNNGSRTVIGLYNGKQAPGVASEEYVPLLPVSVEGYETEWYLNSGGSGVTKGLFCVTRSCENPEILMAWLDQFYSLENYVRARYGEEEDGRWGYNADGKIEFYTLDADKTKELNETAPTIYSYFTNLTPPGVITAEDYEERVALSGVQKVQTENLKMYEKYITDESWPRPYFAEEDSKRLSELRTDIFATLQLKRAEWITGVADIDAEYDNFIAELQKMGIEEFVQIMQETYDVYLEANK